LWRGGAWSDPKAHKLRPISAAWCGPISSSWCWREKWEHPAIRSAGPVCICWWLLMPITAQAATSHSRHIGESNHALG
jgi:hypothetical protein